jgi:hypothetical protein
MQPKSSCPTRYEGVDYLFLRRLEEILWPPFTSSAVVGLELVHSFWVWLSIIFRGSAEERPGGRP